MKYGNFDDTNREYVIDRPDTPAPWVNYLGSPEYGAIISNNAGGYSFARSGANGRILRYIFNSFDQPGRYIYIRDDDSRDYWSASWQPVGKDLNNYKSKCCHGMGYTRMTAGYDGISSEALYYVPLGKSYEVWGLTVTNDSAHVRNLTLSGYAEFTNHGNYEQDQVNLQYSLFITRTLFKQNQIIQQIHGNLDALPEDETVDEKNVTERFFGLAGACVSSYCGDREQFLGRYHGYGNPQGILSGDLGNMTSYNENSCGALSCSITLAPGETKTIAFLLGTGGFTESSVLLDGYADPEEMIKQELQELKKYWYEKFDHLKVNTPSSEFNTMINTWNAYNCFMTFIWSRAASFIYCGLRNGYGYRDTVQDIQGIIHLAPEMAAEKIRFMLSAQVSNGGGLPLVKFTHNPGHEDTPDDASYRQDTGHPAYRADDALWLFPTVYKYIAETGNLEFLNETIPFADKEKASVYEHLKRAVAFSLAHLGPHGMPAGLYADWNDCLRLGADGESSFVAMQFYYAMTVLKQFAKCRNDAEYVKYLEEKQEETGAAIQKLCWDQDRFIRGYTEAGERIGAAGDPEANLWLNPQSWAVISGLAGAEQAETALTNVYEQLNTEYGALLMNPPYHTDAFDGALAVIYNQGTKENSGIFSQSQGWLVLAEALCGHGERAFTYFMENAPAAWNDQAELRRLEPYCYGQFTEGNASEHQGRSHVHWLTGTASTMMVGCVEGILGLRPDLNGITLSPAIPKDWTCLEIEKDFRGKHLHILIENPNGREAGCEKLMLNGNEMTSNYIPASFLTDTNEIRLIL
ncbi:N,N'-diacetylchitobiose phosphorylase [Schaedlerella arabinosiphila]|uniref:N,N'-diacetylchitobiose phosphorylase n=1 Tax=Schaedlerella arabinosiphila TaxID=2044587 RepID=A0A3R8JTY5_9FIRM|nr:N,N'-diacetylchitobiose phosphorylase [Schaedlerella arabinosiphila]RRK34720.1 N,N'-diacetylchitobiose phosphorylase [Schaedlerella arabinosiphila]